MKRLFCILLAALLLLPGCTAAPQETSTPAPGVAPEESAPAAPVDDTTAVAFALELFRQALEEEGANPVISPVSAWLCLAMVMNGAAGETRTAFAEAFGGEADALNAYARTLMRELRATEGNTTIQIADSVWADDDNVEVKEAFLQMVADHYDAEVFSVDLPSSEAIRAINDWVNDKTNGLIPSLREENYPPETVLVLLNTLYFKAKWQNEFMGWQTRDKAFHKADGSDVDAPFMQTYFAQRDCIRARDAEGILLPYDDGKTAFLALRPTDGRTAEELAASLTAASLASYTDAAADTLVNFSMPKFTLSYETSMNDMLTRMGLGSLFDPARADLSNMGTSTLGPLFISWVFQKVKIEVNEEGTEAAAVTEAAAMAGSAMPEEEPFVLHLDSPFVYAVMDLASGMPLFIGVLEDPSAD